MKGNRPSPGSRTGAQQANQHRIFQRLERRIDELEANAEVYDMGKAKTLEEEFQDLEAEAEIEDDLARLKARMGNEAHG